RNVIDFLKLVIDKEGQLVIGLDDEIVAATLVCKDGVVLRK
ncbi:MAG: transhydrogenase alpha subunit, partial [Burkholderia sp.]|nr:transhydrogenase alpha subunit [Burkholderia sp.]